VGIVGLELDGAVAADAERPEEQQGRGPLHHRCLHRSAASTTPAASATVARATVANPTPETRRPARPEITCLRADRPHGPAHYPTGRPSTRRAASTRSGATYRRPIRRASA